jgi:uncharacterized protein (TIGR00255 family)
MKSMTGYGEADTQVRGTKIVVQIRSLNHRHLDLQLRTPREYLGFEEEIRKAIRDKISRGRIDLFINRIPTRAQGRSLEIDEALLSQYLSAVKQAKKQFKLSGEIGVELLSSVPELFRVREIEADAALEKRGLFAALRSALNKLDQSRGREGRQLKADMQRQVRQLRKVSIALEAQALELGIRSQKQSPAPPIGGEPTARLERDGLDLANMVSKGDVNEEVVRLKAHVDALVRAMSEVEPVGKKIDFMLQEVQRELNTIASKAPQLPVVQRVLEGKERVEKIREQSQNIE